jgi:hypothetical protein
MKKGTNGQCLLFALALSSAALFTACQSTTTRTDATLKRLQGYWEGEGAGGKCSITITGTSLLYRAGTNWFKTTFTLPEGTDPRQLHATITDCSPPTNNSIDTVVFAIFKLEDGILTLAEVDGSDKQTTHYELVWFSGYSLSRWQILAFEGIVLLLGIGLIVLAFYVLVADKSRA